MQVPICSFLFFYKARELQTFLEGEGFEVWCSTELEQDFPDSLPDSQPGKRLWCMSLVSLKNFAELKKILFLKTLYFDKVKLF